MATYVMEIRNTARWEDVRYREYTTSARKAEAFKSIPRIDFTDSGHGLVPSVHPFRGRKLPAISALADHVREHLKVEQPNKRASHKETAEALLNGCNALLGLIQLVRSRPDISPEIREALTTSHRIDEAMAAIARATQPAA